MKNTGYYSIRSVLWLNGLVGGVGRWCMMRRKRPHSVIIIIIIIIIITRIKGYKRLKGKPRGANRAPQNHRTTKVIISQCFNSKYIIITAHLDKQ